MGNSQQPNQPFQPEIAENLGHFLPEKKVFQIQTAQIQVQDTPSDLSNCVPVPPTPCFKQDTKINVIPNQILTKMYKQEEKKDEQEDKRNEQEDKKKEQRQFELQLQGQDQKIQKAKANYEKRVQENMQKLKEIKSQRQFFKQVYEESGRSKGKHLDQGKQDDSEQHQIIWGQRVSNNVADPMEEYLKYRFPKDEIDESENYKNWHIYKQKMYKDQMQEINDKEEKLKLLQENLKTNYFTLLGRKDQRLNSSTSYATLKKQSSKPSLIVHTPSPKKKKKPQQNSHSIHSSPLSPRKQSQSRSQSTTAFEFQDSFQQKQTQGDEFPSFISSFIKDMQNYNPQNSSPQSADSDFLAKQIFYFENYASKRRTSFVHSPEEVKRLVAEENQYPSKRKNYERPVRCQENLKDNATFRSRSKNLNKKAKFKEELEEFWKERTETGEKKEESADTSVYYKVYEKIPKKQARMMYSQSEGRLKQVQDFYPYQGSPSQLKDNQQCFPQKIKVNDRLKSSPQKDKTGNEQGYPKLDFDFMKRANTNASGSEIVELTEEEKEVFRRKRSQRDYEARVLERLKMKKIS